MRVTRERVKAGAVARKEMEEVGRGRAEDKGKERRMQ